eukprot:403334343
MRKFSTVTNRLTSENLKVARKANQLFKEERSDTSKFTYLDQQPEFAEIEGKIHPDLQEGLKINNYQYMTEIQSLAIKNGLFEGQNMILTSETGSGKTLAYLLPIINQLLHFQDKKGVPEKGTRFRMNKANEEQMFLSAGEIMYQSQKQGGSGNTKSRLSFGRSGGTGVDDMKGALILSYSKELLNQIYVTARFLDVKERLQINRATSALQMKTPIVEFITPDKDKGEKELTEDEQFDIQLKNVINNASWSITDILLATPVVMSHILDNKEKFDPYDINPAVIVIDEFDELLSNQSINPQLVKILRKFATFDGNKDSQMADLNRRRQFIFTGATIPRTIMNGHDTLNTLYDWFPNIKHIKTETLHRVSQLIEYEWIDLERSHAIRASQVYCEDHEINILVDQVKRSIDVLRNRSIMIFAESKKTIDKVCEALRKAEIKNLPYYHDIGVQGRQTTLHHFFNRELPVLVCSNMASRGLDTINVDHVIQFEFAKNAIDYIHRVGRTGRLGQRGYVTNFTRKGDNELEQQIRELDQKKDSYESLIRKSKSQSSTSIKKPSQK